MKINKIMYWTATILTAVLYVMSAIVDLLRAPEIVENIVRKMGYPMYMLDILGVAKIIAAIILLIPRFPRLKEWAYAGMTIHIIGAIWSHLAIGDTSGLAGTSMLVVAVGLSYFYYRRVEPAGKLQLAM